ncbi:MAG: RNA polymerase sigma factor [Isosphaeraceae bacterium]
MGKSQSRSALRNVQMLFAAGTVAGRTDRELLEQCRGPDEQSRELAFTALIERHGPMVVRTCRTILRDEHAIEDAFQATFLVLLRRTGSLWVRDSLGPWLHQVAYRVASGTRSAAARQRRHEQRASRPADSTELDPAWDDLGLVIHEELDRLPERYRAPILLCCLEGLTREQAAGRLGWRMGTLQSRLARGRERLKGRLIERGIAPGVGIAAAILSQEGSRAAVPAFLVDSTIRAGAHFAALQAAATGAVPATVAKLTEGVLKTMLFHKMKATAGALMAAGLISTGVAVWAQQRPAADSRAEDHAASVASDATAGLTISDRAIVSEPEMPATDGPTDGGTDFEIDPNLVATDEAADLSASVLKYHDGSPDGKKSIGGSGEMIEFSGPSETTRLEGLRIHGSRYGNPQPPRESFLIYFLSHDQKRILHTELAPYSLFERGAENWVEVSFEHPVELPKQFWVVLDFRAHQTKGVFVSFDTSSGGKHSRQGLPGVPSSPVRIGGDWMIEAVLGK